MHPNEKAPTTAEILAALRYFHKKGSNTIIATWQHNYMAIFTAEGHRWHYRLIKITHECSNISDISNSARDQILTFDQATQRVAQQIQAQTNNLLDRERKQKIRQETLRRFIKKEIDTLSHTQIV